MVIPAWAPNANSNSHWSGTGAGSYDAAAGSGGARAAGAALGAATEAGLDFVTVGDFAFYDHVANHIQLLGCEPARFGFGGVEPELARYFAMARGTASEAPPVRVRPRSAPMGNPALEMTKWFDTNYHYLVPEFMPQTVFSLASERLFAEVGEARALGHPVKVALLGPLSFLWLGKEGATWRGGRFRPPQLAGKAAAGLRRNPGQAEGAGVEWVQVDKPILGLDLPDAWKKAFELAYWRRRRGTAARHLFFGAGG